MLKESRDIRCVFDHHKPVDFINLNDLNDSLLRRQQLERGKRKEASRKCILRIFFVMGIAVEKDQNQ